MLDKGGKYDKRVEIFVQLGQPFSIPVDDFIFHPLISDLKINPLSFMNNLFLFANLRNYQIVLKTFHYQAPSFQY